MTTSRLAGVSIRGVAAAVPRARRSVGDDEAAFGADTVRKISESTGVLERRTAGALCTSDLCEAAARALLARSNIDPATIDGVIFVSQTPDYLLPATACVLQHRLGLPASCAALDINLGCSGYVYGLWTACSLATANRFRRVLLLVGDTVTRICSPEDRSVALLFGDAGSATLLELAPDAPEMTFVLGTDGSGWDKLIVPSGGFRNPQTPARLARTVREGGNVRSDADLYMNGADIFAFTLKVVPALTNQLLEESQRSPEDIDAFVFHQANRFMLNHLCKRMKLPPEKAIVALERFGNTSSASIPLALVTHLRDALEKGPMSLVLEGFGVGFSWAGVHVITHGPIVCPLVEVDAPETRMS